MNEMGFRNMEDVDLICWGRNGCNYRGPKEEFSSIDPQHPYQCPKCRRRYTFKVVKKGDERESLPEPDGSGGDGLCQDLKAWGK